MSKLYAPDDRAIRGGFADELDRERTRIKAAFAVAETLFFRMRRAVVFRPPEDERLDVGEEKDLAIHIVHGDGTTSVIDDYSSVGVVILAGTGEVLTAQPVRFKNGVATVRVKKTGLGGLVIGLSQFDAAGTPLEVPIDITATKTLVDTLL